MSKRLPDPYVTVEIRVVEHSYGMGKIYNTPTVVECQSAKTFNPSIELKALILKEAGVK